MNFNVGQIFFVVFDGKTEVYPFRIVERTTIQKLNGEEIIYKCQCPKWEGQVFTVSEILSKGGQLFFSIEEVKERLIIKVTNAVEQIVRKAMELANKHFSDTTNNLESVQEVSINNAEETPSVVRIQLPDGTFANLKK